MQLNRRGEDAKGVERKAEDLGEGSTQLDNWSRSWERFVYAKVFSSDGKRASRQLSSNLRCGRDILSLQSSGAIPVTTPLPSNTNP